MKKKFAILIFLFLAPSIILTGCYDSREVDNMAYVTAIGVDKGTNENLKFTLQFAVPLNISGGIETGEKSEGGKSPLDNMTIEADTLYSAIDYANNSISKQVNVAHCKLLVFSDELAKEGLNKYSNMLLKGKDFRPNTFVAASIGEAGEYLKHISSQLELNPTRYYELIFDKEYSAFTPTTYIKDYLSNSESQEIETVMPLALVVTDETGENPQSQINGMAIFKDNKMVGTATGEETTLYKMLNGTYHHSHFTIQTQDNKTVYALTQNRKPKINVTLKGDTPNISVWLDLSGELISAQEAVLKNTQESEAEVIAVLESQAEDFLKKTATIYDSDIIGFGKYAKRNFWTESEWNDYRWNEKYQNAEFNVQVNFKLIRTGKTNA